MRILLLHPPAFDGKTYIRDAYCAGLSKGHYSWPPLDLVMISGTLAREHEVAVLDASADQLTPDETARRVERSRPEAVVFLTSSASREVDFPFIARLKTALPTSSFVMMGDLAVTRPAEILEGNSFVDGAVVSYMDPEIAAGFTVEGLRPVRNLACRVDDEIAGDERITLRPARIPTPKHELFPLHRYKAPWARRRPLTSTTTSDGCPYRCTFCTVGLLEYTYRPVEDVVDEVRHIRGSGAREVYFQDFLFTAHRKRTLNLCKALTAEGTDISWCCLSKVNTFDEEVLGAMARAGCHTIQLGLESGDDRILEAMDKGFTIADTREAVRLCRNAGLRVDAIFMLGYPGETEAHIRATIDLAMGLPLHFATFVIVTPGHGMPMVEAIRAAGTRIDLDRPYDDTENVLPLAGIQEDRLKAMRERAERRFFLRPKQMARLLAGVRSGTELVWLVREGMRFLRRLRKLPFLPVTDRGR